MIVHNGIAVFAPLANFLELATTRHFTDMNP